MTHAGVPICNTELSLDLNHCQKIKKINKEIVYE